MIEVRHYAKGVLLIWFTLDSVELKKKYPRIQDVVSFDEPVNQHYIPSMVKELKSSLDVDTFWRNEALFRSKIRDYLEDTTRESRRLRITPRDNTATKYKKASQYQFRTKILDCMLQVVYMARHFIKVFEKTTYLDKTSISYRVGFLGHKLKYLYKKAIRILEILNIRQKKQAWKGSVTPPLTLHHRVAKLAVDFDYSYHLMRKMDYIVRPGVLPHGGKDILSSDE